MIALAHAVQIGAALASLMLALMAWEVTGQLSSRVPTISRVLQGWRDSGRVHTAFLGVVATMVLALVVLTGWLAKHLLTDKRSSL